MLKKDELADPNSCLNKARDDQMIFVLIDSDPEFARTIQFWADSRVAHGINSRGDLVIASAQKIVASHRLSLSPLSLYGFDTFVELRAWESASHPGVTDKTWCITSEAAGFRCALSFRIGHQKYDCSDSSLASDFAAYMALTRFHEIMNPQVPEPEPGLPAQGSPG